MGLEIAEIMMDIENAVGVRLSASEHFDGTVGGLVAWVRSEVETGQSTRNVPSVDVDRIVRTIIADRLGLPIESVTAHQHLVRDLDAG